MEIKVVIAFDDRTASIVGQLASAILASKASAPVVQEQINESKKVKKSTKPVELKVGDVVDMGEQIPEITTEDLPESFEEPEAKSTISIDDLRQVVAEAKRAGKKGLKEILVAHGADTVSTLAPSQYASVIKAVKAL